MRAIGIVFILSAALLSTAPAPAQTEPVPVASPCASACGYAAVTPSEKKLYKRALRRYGPAQLTAQQESQIRGLVGAYSQAHPAGSPLDKQSMRQLNRSIRALLTPQQIDALKAARPPHR